MFGEHFVVSFFFILIWYFSFSINRFVWGAVKKISTNDYLICDPCGNRSTALSELPNKKHMRNWREKKIHQIWFGLHYLAHHFIWQPNGSSPGLLLLLLSSNQKRFTRIKAGKKLFCLTKMISVKRRQNNNKRPEWELNNNNRKTPENYLTFDMDEVWNNKRL